MPTTITSTSLTTRVAILALALATASNLALAQTLQLGQPCNITRNRLSSTSHQFQSECIETAYCSPLNNTCSPRQCSTQRFLSKDDTLNPPLCGSGTFCPDEGDQCLPLLPVGQNCQMDRDDECQPPPNAAQLASPWNNQGAICLKFTCYWQNVTVGNECVVDNNLYIGFRSDRSQFADIISRDNCMPGLYCDAPTTTCKQQLTLAQQCSADKMCQSHNCGTDNTCHLPAGTVVKIPIYQYVLTGVGIIGFILIVLVGLFLIHKRDRAKRQREIKEYYHEQTTYRSSIIALHTAARERTSIYSDSTSRFSQYDEHGQMVYRDDDSGRGLMAGRRMSTLRNSVIAEDDDSDEERAQGRGLLNPYASRDSLADDTPRQSFDYGQASGSGSGYNAVPMRNSVDLPMGAGTPRRPGQQDSPFKDPWENN